MRQRAFCKYHCEAQKNAVGIPPSVKSQYCQKLVIEKYHTQVTLIEVCQDFSTVVIKSLTCSFKKEKHALLCKDRSGEIEEGEIYCTYLHNLSGE